MFDFSKFFVKMALLSTNNEQLYTSDYLKIYEDCLDERFNKFQLKCDNFQKIWNEANKIFQKNFNECDCQNAGIKDENFMRDNCERKLQEISNYKKLCDQLKNQINEQNLIDFDQKPIDIEILGLSIKNQNEILTQRINDFEYSKHMAQKILDQLFKELKFAEEKEIEVTIEMKNYENALETLKAQQKTIEDEINAEVKRLKKSFVEIYMKKFIFKKKYDENDQKIRLDLKIREKSLQDDLTSKSWEITNVKAKIAEQKEKLMQEDLYESLYADKVENLIVDIAKESKRVEEVENKIKYLEKNCKHIINVMEKHDEEFEKMLQNIKENSLANQRINEIYLDKFDAKFEHLEETTMKKFYDQEKFIKKLLKTICKLTDQICKENLVVEQLKTDIDFFLNREPKFVIGADHMGGNFVHLNK